VQAMAAATGADNADKGTIVSGPTPHQMRPSERSVRCTAPARHSQPGYQTKQLQQHSRFSTNFGGLSDESGSHRLRLNTTELKTLPAAAAASYGNCRTVMTTSNVVIPTTGPTAAAAENEHIDFVRVGNEVISVETRGVSDKSTAVLTTCM
jgi:hypothetical protein